MSPFSSSTPPPPRGDHPGAGSADQALTALPHATEAHSDPSQTSPGAAYARGVFPEGDPFGRYRPAPTVHSTRSSLSMWAAVLSVVLFTLPFALYKVLPEKAVEGSESSRAAQQLETYASWPVAFSLLDSCEESQSRDFRFSVNHDCLIALDGPSTSGATMVPKANVTVSQVGLQNVGVKNKETALAFQRGLRVINEHYVQSDTFSLRDLPGSAEVSELVALGASDVWLSDVYTANNGKPAVALAIRSPKESSRSREADDEGVAAKVTGAGTGLVSEKVGDAHHRIEMTRPDKPEQRTPHDLGKDLIQDFGEWGSNLVIVQVTLPDPSLASPILDALLQSAYLDENTEEEAHA